MQNKAIYTLSLLCLLVPTKALSMESDDSWFGEWSAYLTSFFVSDQLPEIHPIYQPAPAPEQPECPMGTQLAALNQDLSECMDILFATHEQDKTTRKQIECIKQLTFEHLSRIYAKYDCHSIHHFRSTAHQHLDQSLALAVCQHAGTLYKQKAASISGTPSYSPDYLADQFAHTICEDALKVIKFNEPGVLAFFVGTALEKRIDAQLKTDFNFL